MRISEISRKTNETEIKLKLNLDGKGSYIINTGCGFLNHMLELFAKHGNFDLEIICNGDIDVDYHHTVEDVGIVMGEAFKKAVGDKRGIYRYGNMLLPMDEALVMCAIDISGRGFLGYNVEIKQEKVGNFDTQLVKEFFLAFARSMELTLHFNMLAGENAHHIIEACYKGFGRAMKKAIAIDNENRDSIPSTKGVI